MTLSEIEIRMDQIKTEMEADGADLDKLTEEVRSLNAQKAELRQAAEAEEKRRSLFGEESSCMLVINKASQRLSIHPGGSLAGLISAAQADRIVSRADKELARGHFFSAASDAFSRLAGLAGSTKSAASLRIFSMLFLALMIGLTLAGVFVLFRSRQGRHFE